ncbi:hypothetical protein F3Y22_tig00110678pilonHSYRG00486 [Hibiscus syriacus]|uniref:Pentatricopeptide repeat-containing protein n=1 Tax=Hibiscus syriacus TaxID=106335 RepID=A0A6A2ZY55_HIBSY|nr:hypothetical protein F3Y22_tig00110678pilonHSYRG00486 [Hibiscus syriacus]
MIVGYLQNGLNNYALELFRLMVREGPKANNFSLAAMPSMLWFKDLVSLASMIMALTQHGLGEDGFGHFEKLLAAGIKPDHITYVGVLSACTHVGLVDQDWRYYNMMKDFHKIEPTLSHYASMVDLLGRADSKGEVAATGELMHINVPVKEAEDVRVLWILVRDRVRVTQNTFHTPI